MRLWHEELIPFLPRQQLLGQHRECCALRGKGWGKKHATVDYVFEHPIEWLVAYHYKIINEMCKRGYNIDLKWTIVSYRGKLIDFEDRGKIDSKKVSMKLISSGYNKKSIYPEHDDKYLKECLENLKNKGIEIKIEK